MELLLTNGGIGLLDKWRHARTMRGDDMAVVSRRNYIGRSIVLCQRKERHSL